MPQQVDLYESLFGHGFYMSSWHHSDAHGRRPLVGDASEQARGRSHRQIYCSPLVWVALLVLRSNRRSDGSSIVAIDKLTCLLLGESFDTPQTAIATTIALPNTSEGFEITPVVERAVELYFIHLYPTYPVLCRETMHRCLQRPDLLSRSEQVLLFSICAMTLQMVDDWPNLGNEQRAVSARLFMGKCRQLRIDWDYQEEAEYYDVLASLFIANTFFELKCRRASWFFVREAINLAIIAGLHSDGAYIDVDDQEQVRRRRAYALLFITERGAAILDGFPVSIFNPPPMPSIALPGEDPSTVAGLMALHSLFCLLDVKFVKLWNSHMQASFDNTGYSDLLLLQSHLRDLHIDRSGLSDIQRADVLITQQWLRLTFWQAALRLGYISTGAEDRAFTYEYPIDIAMAMCDVVKALPPVAIQVRYHSPLQSRSPCRARLRDLRSRKGAASAFVIYARRSCGE